MTWTGLWVYIDKEVVEGARRIRREKLREHQCIEGYTRSNEKRVEWDRENMWSTCGARGTGSGQSSKEMRVGERTKEKG